MIARTIFRALPLLPLLLAIPIGCKFVATTDQLCESPADTQPQVEECGVGICHTLHEIDACSPTACQPGQPHEDEVCGNGFDDNCDGQVDEGCACEDGDEKGCYTGSVTTGNVGLCQDGKQICQNGFWGACIGAILPTGEICADGFDNDCDGKVDDGCPCSDGEEQGCYGGPTSTLRIGICRTGKQTCNNGSWGACKGTVVPQIELPNGLDDDCDGEIDEEFSCVHDRSQPCYTGPDGTEGVGRCTAGTQNCFKGGWEACIGDILPAPEICNGIDDDCNGQVDEGDVGAGMPCLTGMPGVCTQGTTVCLVDGLFCDSNIKPTTETCNAIDDNCDGVVDDGPFCCPDGVQNGDETDVDCGGSCAQKCQAGQKCVLNENCASGTCTNGICQP